MARIANFSRPKNTRRALKQMFGYLGRHKWYMFAIAFLVSASAMANIMGTYLLKPVINNYILPGDIPGLMRNDRSHGSYVCTRRLSLPVPITSSWSICPSRW